MEMATPVALNKTVTIAPDLDPVIVDAIGTDQAIDEEVEAVQVADVARTAVAVQDPIDDDLADRHLESVALVLKEKSKTLQKMKIITTVTRMVETKSMAKSMTMPSKITTTTTATVMTDEALDHGQ